MNQHNVLLICLLTGYVAVNVFAAFRSRGFLLTQSRPRLALYGIAFLLWGSLIMLGIELMELACDWMIKGLSGSPTYDPNDAWIGRGDAASRQKDQRYDNFSIVTVSMPLPNTQARESSLNQAILDLARTEFIFGPYDPQVLVLESCGPYYADEVAFWLGAELITGREEALARLADSLEPMYTFLEMGTMTVESFQVVLTMKDPQGQLVSHWELRLGGPHATGIPLRWQTIRLWRNGVVIAERIARIPESGGEQ